MLTSRKSVWEVWQLRDRRSAQVPLRVLLPVCLPETLCKHGHTDKAQKYMDNDTLNFIWDSFLKKIIFSASLTQIHTTLHTAWLLFNILVLIKIYLS